MPATLKKSNRPIGERPRPATGGDRPRRFGDREGGREGYRGGFGRGASGDKAGAPGAFQPTFGGAQ